MTHHRRMPAPSDETGQTSTFLLKAIVVVAVIGFLAIDLGGPIVTRLQVDNDVSNATKDAARVYDTTLGNVEAVAARLETQLAGTGIEVKSIEVVPNPDSTKGSLDANVLEVTVEKDTKSMLFGKLEPLKPWYHVEVTAEAAVK